ncbi:MAG: hypothetical protein ACRD2C_11670 [Acidimicrobiales bacterium]
MSRVLRADDPLALAVVVAIRGGDVDGLQRLLRDNVGLAIATIRDEGCGEGGVSRTLLHVATDWPGHFPDVAATIAAHFAGDPFARPTRGARVAIRRRTG